MPILHEDITDPEIHDPKGFAAASVATFLTKNGAGVLEWTTQAGTIGVSDHTLLTNIGTNTHAQIDSHIAAANPHGITAITVGLGNADDTSDADKPISTATQTALNLKQNEVLTTNGDIVFRNAGTTTRLGVGTNGEILTVTAGVPAWATAPSGVTDHTLLTNIGTNTHAQIDTHIADNTVHFTDPMTTTGDIIYESGGPTRLAAGTNSHVLTLSAGVPVWAAAPGAGGGEANTTSNDGAGEGLAKAKVGTDLPFKSLVAGTNITLTPTADTVTIDASGGGSALEVEDESVSLSTAVTKINFAGAGVTATAPIADEILVTIPGGGSVDDTAYPTGWDTDTTTAPSRNAVFDKIDLVDTAVGLNTAKVSADGLVTTHSDVDDAGSGIIISAAERTAIGTNTTTNAGVVTVHSDVTDAGSGAIITGTERTNFGTAFANTHTHANSAVLNATTASFLLADETKLDGIETSATADQTGAEIKTAYELEANTNAFTDANVTTLGNQSGTNTGDEVAATDSVAGVIEIATTAEVDTGTDNTRAITPASLNASSPTFATVSATNYVGLPAEIGIAVGDETSSLSTGTTLVTFRVPFAMTLTEVRASVTTAPTGSVITVDINDSGATILSTKLTIDATEKTSTTAATPPVLSDTSLADDAEVTIDLDTVGSTIAGAGLKIWLIGTRT